MRYRVIREDDRRDPIRLMCRALAVSPAGYYAWRTRPVSPRAVANRDLLSAIRVLHQESRETYGSPRIWAALVKQGHGIGEHRVARLMRGAGIRAKTVPKWRATTQYPGSDLHCRGAQSGVGRGLDLRLDAGGLALSGRPAGSVLTPSGRLGRGSAVNRQSDRAGPHDGAGEPSSHGGAPTPLGPRPSVCRYELSASA